MNQPAPNNSITKRPADRKANPGACLLCGDPSCDCRHPEVSDWHEGMHAIEAVLNQLRANKKRETV